VTRAMVALALAGAAALGACRRDDPGDQRTETVTPRTVEQARAGWPEGLGAIIDSANAAYSAGDYETASTLYRQATQMGPDVTAGWFGIYMAEHARGNVEAADSAMQRARALAPEASLIHGAPGDTLPPGHP
jgi:tetratricopeptide (TPR) repeat protein